MSDMQDPPDDADVILQDQDLDIEEEAPGSALPSAWLFRGSLLTLVVGTALAVFLIASPPESEGAGEPTRTIATSTRPPVSPTATATPEGATPSVTLPAPSPTSTTPTPDPASQRTHTVQAGDTLGGIAEQYGVSVEEIVALNPGLDPNAIVQGQVLQIPPAP